MFETIANLNCRIISAKFEYLYVFDHCCLHSGFYALPASLSFLSLPFDLDLDLELDFFPFFFYSSESLSES
jgi:hypothetical protein